MVSSERATYVADGTPKPYIHPLRAPSGRVLSVESPPDHVWHRGLWFAIKYLDGDNFWEEEEPFGIQRHTRPDRVEWVRPDGTVALREHRNVAEMPLGDRAYALDWTSTLETAGNTVQLERTPFTTWGGYGGLAFRGASGWTDTRLLVADGTEHRRAVAIASPWCDLSNRDAGVTILDHPQNPRHPVPWYGASRSRVYGDGWANFLNAAFLFHEGMTLEPGASLTMRYRVIVHDGAWAAARAQAAWAAWVA